MGVEQERSPATRDFQLGFDRFWMNLLWLLCALPSLAVGSQLAKFHAIAAANEGVVPLTSALYDEITASPREFSVSIVLTAMAAQFKCTPCA